MSGGPQAAAAATAAVYLGDVRVGSAVLVDDRHLLTAAHVLRRQAGLAEKAEVLLPSGPAPGTRLPARWVPLGPDVTADVAVLDLGLDPAVALPRPVELWPAGRLPARVSVFGFPRAEKDPTGWWRGFDVAGPVGRDLVQVDWVGDVGTLPGHSGGPVLDTGTGALVGVLTEGSEAGRFDRFVPLPVIAHCWPGLRRPWLMAGAEGRDHFTQRGLGQRSGARGGDLFRGRDQALTGVRAWLTGEEHPGRPLVVTGQPGAGKSAVLARTVLDLEADGIGPGLAFHTRGATHTDFLRAVADLTGYDGELTRRSLVEALKETPVAATGPWLVACDALDEAAHPVDRDNVAETLTELARLATLRVAVATRPLAADRYAPGAPLPRLGVRSADSKALVDLDTDYFFDPNGLHAFAAALLTQDGSQEPGPSGTAWEAYRASPALRGRLAAVIAGRAGRNFLVAALAAAPLSEEDSPVDPDAPGFDPRLIPSGVGEALQKYLQQLPEDRRERAHQLLTALAYARGDGVEDRLWLRFTHTLGYPAEQVDLDRLRAGGAADYLLQTAPGDEGPVTRLFHQALVDELLAFRHRRTDERALLDGLRRLADAVGWAAAPRYLRQHIAEHADATGQLEALLEDVHYLAVADFTRLLPSLPAAVSEQVSPLVVLLRQAGARATPLPPDRRLGLLALAAAHLGFEDLQVRLTTAANLPLPVRWAHSLGVPHRELIGHRGWGTAVAIGRAAGRDIIISGSWDHTVRVWDAGSGQPVSEPLTGHTGPVTAVKLGRFGDQDVIVSGSKDGTVRLWDPTSGQSVGKPLTGHTGAIEAVATSRVGDRSVIVSGGEDGTVRLWDTDTGQLIGTPLTGHTDAVYSLAIGRAGSRDVIVSGSWDYTVRLWDATSGRPTCEPLIGHTDLVAAVAIGRANGRDVIVSGSSDGTLCMWNPMTGLPAYTHLIEHPGPVNAVAIGRAGDYDVIVSGSSDGTVRLWNIATGQPIGKPLTGHTGAVEAVAIGRAVDRDVIVSAGDDGPVRIWDVAIDQSVGKPLTGHSGAVSAVAIGRAVDRQVIVSAGDSSVRIWDAVTGRLAAEPLTGRAYAVRAVIIDCAANRDVIVAAGSGWSSMGWVRDATTGELLAPPLTGHTLPVTSVAIGRTTRGDVIVSGSDDRTLKIWDLVTGQLVGAPLTGHTSGVTSVATGRTTRGDVIVSGSDDRTLRTWDLVTGQPVGAPLTGHTSGVTSVAIGYSGGRDVIVSGSWDRTVRRWDAATGTPVGDPLTGHTRAVKAVAIGRAAGRDLIVSGSSDGTIRIWDPGTGRCEAVLDLLGPVEACYLDQSGLLAAAIGRAICAFAAPTDSDVVT